LNFCLENPATPAIYKQIARRELDELSSKMIEAEIAEATGAAKELNFDLLVNEMVV
jgi:hypothetical protein